MYIKHTNKRLADVIKTRLSRLLSTKNILTVIVSVSLLVVVTPVIIYFFFSSTFLQNKLQDKLESESITKLTVAIAIYPTDSQSLRGFEKVYVYAPSKEQLDDYVVQLDGLYSETEFIPDYAAKDLQLMCKDLIELEEKLSQIAIVGNESQVVQASYACDSLGLKSYVQITQESTLVEKYESGVALLSLIFRI